MKTTFKFMFATGFALAAVAGCSSDDAPSEIDEAQARAKASQVVPGGTVGAVTKLDVADEHRWVASVTLANGAAVDVEIERASGIVAEIKGEKGPFDYEIPAPAAGFLTYGQAKSKALAAKVGTVEVWEVKPPETMYEFYVREAASSRLFEIKMDATSGNVTTLVEKDKPD
jgi:uncharacterized membrane protein YkoI